MQDELIVKIKDCLESICSIFKRVEDAGIVSSGSDCYLTVDFKMDILDMMLYFCASSGTLSEENADFINRLLNVETTAESYIAMIDDNNIYSTEYKKANLASLQAIKPFDNLINEIYQDPVMPSIISIMESIAKTIINMNGGINEQISQDYKVFFTNLKKNYMSQDNRDFATTAINETILHNNTLKAYYLKKKELNKKSEHALKYKEHDEIFYQSVLYIETEKGAGSAFIITQNGYVITCAHVVKNSKEIYVKVKCNDIYDVFQAQLVKADYAIDIALLKIEEGDYYYSYLELEKSPYPGEEIIILGYPFGKNVNDDVMALNISFAKGYVSSNQVVNGINRTLLDISAKAGNSGSPIISTESGKVIGILCGSMLGGLNNREEINYMIPISYIDKVLDKN